MIVLVSKLKHLKKREQIDLVENYNCIVVVCSESMFQKRYVKSMTRIYKALRDKGATFCVFLPEDAGVGNHWSREDYLKQAPDDLKFLFSDEKYVFKFQKYFHEEDQEIVRLFHTVS